MGDPINAELIPVLQLVELHEGQPRAVVERLSSICSATDPKLAAFTSEAARYADLVLGPEWRRDDAIAVPSPPLHGLTNESPS